MKPENKLPDPERTPPARQGANTMTPTPPPTYTPPEREPTILLQPVRVTHDLAARFYALCKRLNITAAEAERDAIREWVEKNEAK